jgi:hypothetical protein
MVLFKKPPLVPGPFSDATNQLRFISLILFYFLTENRKKYFFPLTHFSC